MGIENAPKFNSKDGCVYVYNPAEKQWYKFCPTDVLPLDVKTQVRELKEKADALLDA